MSIDQQSQNQIVTITEAIKEGRACKEDYLLLIKAVFSPTPDMISGTIGLFECYLGMGDDLQTSFDKAVKYTADIMYKGAMSGDIFSKKKKTDNFLNDLLEQAKAWEQAYRAERQKIKSKEKDRDDVLIKNLYKENENAWNNLRKAIDANLPVKFVSDTGESDTIAITAAMTADLSLYYSTNPEATICNNAILLTSIKSLDKV